MADQVDIVAVNIKTGAERVLTSVPERDADACIRYTIWRRGVDEEFYTAKPHPYTPPALQSAGKE